jgi:hypothetical protein
LLFFWKNFLESTVSTQLSLSGVGVVKEGGYKTAYLNNLGRMKTLTQATVNMPNIYYQFKEILVKQFVKI